MRRAALALSSTVVLAAPGAGADLTARERKIAELVATGRRNSEVAAALGVRTKTVEYHLTRVYRKLGVRSRTELAARMAAGHLGVSRGSR